VPKGSRSAVKIKVKVPHRASFSEPYAPENDHLDEVFDEKVTTRSVWLEV